MTTLASKVALVLRGASGIGAAHARAIALADGRVVLADIQDDIGQALADKICAQARFIHLFITSAADWITVIAAKLATFGALNVLVNNAEIINSDPLGGYIEADYLAVVSVNWVGTFLGMSATAGGPNITCPSQLSIYPRLPVSSASRIGLETQSPSSLFAPLQIQPRSGAVVTACG